MKRAIKVLSYSSSAILALGIVGSAGAAGMGGLPIGGVALPGLSSHSMGGGAGGGHSSSGAPSASFASSSSKPTGLPALPSSSSKSSSKSSGGSKAPSDASTVNSYNKTANSTNSKLAKTGPATAHKFPQSKPNPTVAKNEDSANDSTSKADAPVTAKTAPVSSLAAGGAVAGLLVGQNALSSAGLPNDPGIVFAVANAPSSAAIGKGDLPKLPRLSSNGAAR